MSMIYLPDDWINNKENYNEVRQLITDRLGRFKFNDDYKKVKDRVKELGEYKILEEFNKDSFS